MSGEGDGSFWSAAIGVIVVIVLRIVDYVLPTGKHLPHLPWVDDEEENSDEQDY